MDMAKALAALGSMFMETVADVRAAIMEADYRRERQITPWIGIPTTSGTGSEVTCWATVWDQEKGEKYSLSDPRLYADAAVILPELTYTMPTRLSVSTALDALCHATEAYWSVKTNPLTRMYALQAIRFICTVLPRLKEEPSNREFRRQLSLASLYAGLAFSNTETTACHAISYPLTLGHGITHGIAASFTLSSVLKINQRSLLDSEQLFAAFGVECAEEVAQVMKRIYQDYGIPDRLQAFGITPSHIQEIAYQASTHGRMDNNPVKLSPSQIENMLRALL